MVRHLIGEIILCGETSYIGEIILCGETSHLGKYGTVSEYLQ